MKPLKRLLQDRITSRMEANKAVLIFGARRVGKTILINQLVNNFEGKTMLLNGEDYDTLALLNECSIANYRHLLEGVKLLAIDEAQNIPTYRFKIKVDC